MLSQHLDCLHKSTSDRAIDSCRFQQEVFQAIDLASHRNRSVKISPSLRSCWSPFCCSCRRLGIRRSPSSCSATRRHLPAPGDALGFGRQRRLLGSRLLCRAFPGSLGRFRLVGFLPLRGLASSPDRTSSFYSSLHRSRNLDLVHPDSH